MNNEEKILTILERMEGDISDLKEDVSGLKEDVSGLKEDVSGLKEDVSGLKEDVSEIKVRLDEHGERLQRVENRVIVIENDHGRKLDILLDGQTQLTRVTEELRGDVRVLKARSDAHDLEILALKQARAKKAKKSV